MEEDYHIVDGITLEQLSSLPEDQLLNITCDMVRWCDHTIRGMCERIDASLAKCDAMDHIAELYSQVNLTNYQ
jgi:hypothetical protein